MLRHCCGQVGDLSAHFLRTVAERSAALSASWMVAGFAHGVPNTNNMNITGESFDYGPHRFVLYSDPDLLRRTSITPVYIGLVVNQKSSFGTFSV